MTQKLKILFLCTGNACRSQMSEGWAQYLKGDVIEAYSAGVASHGVDPRAAQVMAEVGVDISGHASKHVDDLVEGSGRVVTEGSRARDCPGLWLLGYGDWTGPASATLIGVGHTARETVSEIEDYLDRPRNP